MVKKMALAVACLSALLAVSIPVSAESSQQYAPEAAYTQEMAPRYTHIKKFHADCSLQGGTVSINAFVSPLNSNYQTSLSVTLQRQEGSQWKNVKTWSAKGSGTRGTVFSKEYAVKEGTYRIKVTGKVLDGTKVLETATIYG